MMTTQRMLAAAALSLFLVIPGTATAQFTFTTIDVPGSASTAANGNSPNAIVGEFVNPGATSLGGVANPTHGYVLTKDGFTTIDVPGAWYTTVNGVNANGDIVGIYRDDLDNPLRRHGFILSKGKFTTLDAPGSVRTSASFINAKGQVVGVYRDADDVTHGFIWTKGTFTTIDVAGAVLTSIIGINDVGEVAGVYLDEAGFHGFVREKNSDITTLDVPDADGFTVSQGISDSGHVVGLYADETGTSHGFIWSKGVYVTIDVPGAFWTEVYSINANGDIVGAYEDADGVHGFVGTINP